MICQKDNPDQTAPEGKSDLRCHYLPLQHYLLKQLILPEEIE